jgi:hypothetical protein
MVVIVGSLPPEHVLSGDSSEYRYILRLNELLNGWLGTLLFSSSFPERCGWLVLNLSGAVGGCAGKSLS